MFNHHVIGFGSTTTSVSVHAEHVPSIQTAKGAKEAWVTRYREEVSPERPLTGLIPFGIVTVVVRHTPDLNLQGSGGPLKLALQGCVWA